MLSWAEFLNNCRWYPLTEVKRYSPHNKNHLRNCFQGMVNFKVEKSQNLRLDHCKSIAENKVLIYNQAEHEQAASSNDWWCFSVCFLWPFCGSKRDQIFGVKWWLCFFCLFFIHSSVSSHLNISKYKPLIYLSFDFALSVYLSKWTQFCNISLYREKGAEEKRVLSTKN